MSEKTMTDEDFDLAVGSITSFYQSKRAKLKQQVTGWMGKFRICKSENNALRRHNKQLHDALRYHREQEARKGILCGQLETKIEGLEQELKEARALAGVLV